MTLLIDAMEMTNDLQDNSQWKEVKKVIRAVLLTDIKRGMTISAMKQRYIELWQAPLCCEAFGFQDDIEMLRAMPDVVT